MTRVFVYEYTCAAPPASIDAGGAAALCAEGEAMLAAVTADFERIPGVDVVTLRHARDEETDFRAAVRQSDWSLIIAPEFHDILLTRCRWVRQEGGRLLGPNLAAIELCADKLALSRHWEQHGVLTPTTLEALITVDGEWVVKPRFGAGSLETRKNGPIHAIGEFGPMVAQPYVPGFAASAALLIGPRGHIALQPAEQELSSDGAFQYRGGRIPLDAKLAERATRVGRSAITVVEGLMGYVGVDVILGDDGRDWAIEINPRITTSYIGLRSLSESNLAEAMLTIASGDLPIIRWRSGSVVFAADGSISHAVF